MTKVRITKEFKFEMAHALWNYNGACKNIHGHSYRLFVTVIGEPSGDSNDTKIGMLIDFADLKEIVNKNVINRFDHALVVNNKAPNFLLQNIEQMFEKYYLVDYQPTCENLVIDMAKRIQNNLTENVKLFSVKLLETTTSYAEWYAVDNE